MLQHRILDADVRVAPQIGLGDVAEAAALGVQLIINNRPDGEDPDQPGSAAMERAVRDAGMDYLHLPIAGFPEPRAVAETAAALSSGRSLLMFCRSGTRSAVAWALAMRSLGRAEPEALRAAAAAAGYDLSRLPL